MPLLNRSAKRDPSAPPGRPFGSDGGPDPVEAGRRGGISSGESRRNRERRELEARIAGTKNGAALLGLLKEQRQDEWREVRERERGVREREDECLRRELRLERDMDETLETRQEIKALTTERDARLEEIAQAKDDLAALKATIAELAAEHDLELVEEDGPDA